jgi:hypothetical protein
LEPTDIHRGSCSSSLEPRAGVSQKGLLTGSDCVRPRNCIGHFARKRLQPDCGTTVNRKGLGIGALAPPRSLRLTKPRACPSLSVPDRRGDRPTNSRQTDRQTDQADRPQTSRIRSSSLKQRGTTSDCETDIGVATFCTKSVTASIAKRKELGIGALQPPGSLCWPKPRARVSELKPAGASGRPGNRQTDRQTDRQSDRKSKINDCARQKLLWPLCPKRVAARW